jgi:HrpA-like RNA helicase
MFPFFKKIIISQPRRISAITLAERVAEEMKVVIGE